mgnify:CR=1 FL=1
MQKHMFHKMNGDYKWNSKFLSQVNLPMLTTIV